MAYTLRTSGLEDAISEGERRQLNSVGETRFAQTLYYGLHNAKCKSCRAYFDLYFEYVRSVRSSFYDLLRNPSKNVSLKSRGDQRYESFEQFFQMNESKIAEAFKILPED